MNLENLNLVELNAQEVQKIEGGWAHARGLAGVNWDHMECFLLGIWDGL